MTRRFRGIIFDLDDTLFDCTGQLTGPARTRAAQIFAQAKPQLRVNDLIREQADRSEQVGSSEAIRQMGRHHNLPQTVVNNALAAYNRNAVEAIEPFPDAIPTLKTLQTRGYKLALVTTGRPDRQRQKVDLLGLASFFKEKNGTLVLHDDRQSADKDPFIARAAQNLGLACESIVAVGDKLDAEIAAANHLGMHAVRLRHGRQKNRKPQSPDEQPDVEIDRIGELLTLLH